MERKTNQSEDSTDASANWIIDNYNTGYYVLPNSGILKIRNSNQITPYQNQTTPSQATIDSNVGNNYYSCIFGSWNFTNEQFLRICLYSFS
ncbi:hypothetical protein [Flavobacterium palustre]|uniref:hypothetical protein n=1 Tax=Flavobacterium palustre TaxID=1476463 RepID=UPI003606C55F